MGGALEVVLALFLAQVPDIEDTYAEHTRGVELARKGYYEQGLAILERLLEQFPDNYPLQRDVIMITIWKGDCARALQRFSRIRGYPELESYFVPLLVECYLQLDRPYEARVLAQDARARYPRDERIADLLEQARNALEQRQLRWRRREFYASISTSDSDRGFLEWRVLSRVAAPLWPGAEIFSRFALTVSEEKSFAAADQRRPGIGIEQRLFDRLALGYEMSWDIRTDRRQRHAVSGRLYGGNWDIGADAVTYSEQTPLRGRAAGIEGRRWGLSGYYHRQYVWFLSMGLDAFEFSDRNQRRQWYARGGYAVELKPHREQRLILALSGVTNTLSDAVYFNPRRDLGVDIVHRTDFVYTSTRFTRHVDHLVLSAGSYIQYGFDARPRWRVRFEQDYDFNPANALVWGAAIGSAVYDGAAEIITQVDITWRWRF